MDGASIPFLWPEKGQGFDGVLSPFSKAGSLVGIAGALFLPFVSVRSNTELAAVLSPPTRAGG